jgi:colanic acid/amylovoran biosynthesis glycosyltransferase
VKRPTVLHCVRDWVRPSEGFVADTVRTTTATRAVVVCGTSWPTVPHSDVPVVSLEPVVSRLPIERHVRARRTGIASVALTRRARLLHAHFGYWAPHAAAVARRLRLPLVVSVHGHDVLVEGRDDPDVLGALRSADLVVVPSGFLADRLAGSVPAERVAVLPSGVDLADLPFRVRGRAADRPPVVTFAGRFVPKKGVQDAVAAFARLRDAGHVLDLRFVGYGPGREELLSALSSLKVTADVRDGAPPGAVIAALAETDLLVTPSRTGPDGDADTLGLVNVQAQAMGVPLVSTLHGGIPEAVSPNAGLLVPEGDVDALTGALDRLLAQPERWAEMGRAGRQHVALRFELGACVADLEEQYLSLIRSGVPAARRRPPVTTPSVTAVVVTRDRRELLQRCLSGLAAQTYQGDLDLVVVDNGCTDGTSEYLSDVDQLAGRPVRVLRNTSAESTSRARNQGVAAGGGELLVFTDDDCRPESTWVEALVAGFRDGVGLVQGRTRPEGGGPIPPLARSQWTLAEYGLYETANVAYRREALQSAGGFDTAFADQLTSFYGQRFGYPFGEDTVLAWRVKRSGVASRFAADAVVRHHVFRADLGLLFRRAYVSCGFPVVVGEVPELRRSFLVGGVFLGRRRALFLAAVLGGALARPTRGRSVVWAVPYAWELLQPLRRGRRQRLAAAPALLAVDVVTEAALLYGSIRSGQIVL